MARGIKYQRTNIVNWMAYCSSLILLLLATSQPEAHIPYVRLLVTAMDSGRGCYVTQVLLPKASAQIQLAMI